MFEVTLPYPISVNAAYRNASRVEVARGTRGRIKTRAYMTWQRAAGWDIQAALRDLPPVPSPVKVTIEVVRPDRRRRDLDNLPKAILDTLVDLRVMEDDRHVDELNMRWLDEAEFKGCRVTVESIERAAA